MAVFSTFRPSGQYTGRGGVAVCHISFRPQDWKWGQRLSDQFLSAVFISGDVGRNESIFPAFVAAFINASAGDKLMKRRGLFHYFQFIRAAYINGSPYTYYQCCTRILCMLMLLSPKLGCCLWLHNVDDCK